MRLTARIYPHGNQENMKDRVRRDSFTAQLGDIRLMIFIVTLSTMKLGIVDIIGAYMKISPIKRQIYLILPREWARKKRGSVWKFLKLPYGIKEAGIQWDQVMEA